MKLPRLKLPIKELPLVALGVTAVLAASVFGQPLIRYLLVAMFFGILSKETRWTFWIMNFLIGAFSAFRLLLSTDRETVMFDLMYRMSVDISKRIVYNGNVSNNYLAPAKDALVGLGNNPIFSSPVVITIISIVMGVISAALWMFSVVVMVASFIMVLPIIVHVTLMLYTFHRNEIVNMVEDVIFNESIPEHVGRLVAPYIVQGMAIQTLLMAAILPLIFYKILKRTGFYKRIPGVQS